jgi:hypothetical protein
MSPSRLSLVMVLKNLQLSSPKSRMHTPNRPSGEPSAGHQLVWSINEALEDCRCSNIKSVLSTDKRSLFGFICSLQYRLLVFRSSLCYLICASRHLYSLLGARSSCNIVPWSIMLIYFHVKKSSMYTYTDLECSVFCTLIPNQITCQTQCFFSCAGTHLSDTE